MKASLVGAFIIFGQQPISLMTIDLRSFLVLLAIVLSVSTIQNSGIDNRDLPGQTAPPDMIFVAGNDSIQPFYISQYQEPIINYVIYLKWLKHIHISTPEMFYKALPQRINQYGNTEVDTAYFYHHVMDPKMAFEPIRHLSWLQIQEYLIWKTDRLNELILEKTGLIEVSLDDQADGMSFNLEAYFYGQYYPIKLQSIKKNTDYDFYVSFLDGILFTGFRLPTKNEWLQAKEYGLHSSEKTIIGDIYFSIFNNSRLNEISGMDRQLDNYYASVLSLKAKEFIRTETLSQEWLLNTTSFPNANWLNAYRKSGYTVFSKAVKRRPDGTMGNKDSIGRLSFRYIGIEKTGFPVPVQIKPHRKFKVIKNPYSIFETPDSLQVGSNDSIRVPVYHKRLTIDPSTSQLQELSEESYPRNTGFRCVLPYTGNAVLKGYKLKW